MVRMVHLRYVYFTTIKKGGENERLKKYLRGRIMFWDQLNVDVNKRKESLVNLLFWGFVTKWEM